MPNIMNGYLKKLQEKCNLPDKFIEITISLFDKLIEFGYVPKYSIHKLSKKLYENIDTVILSDTQKYDYKSGYYDASRKVLYIRDINNVQSVYLRLIYILTTKEIDENTFNVGYSKAEISNMTYKIVHSNFGLNRAIVSNLVCRLLYTLPTTLSIVPTYRTYENDFLGVKVESDNDMYFLEGKIVRQLCFVLDINEEVLYNNLFKNNPRKSISKLLNKNYAEEIFKTLDDVSRMYSNYNKLCYFNRLLSDNYIEIRKHCISKEDVLNQYLEKEKELLFMIKGIIYKIKPELEDEENTEQINLGVSLNEQINNLEEQILTSVSEIQAVLVQILLNRKRHYNSINYVINLKKLESMLVLNNKVLSEELYETITHNVIHANEQTCTNIIEKIKYSLSNYILSNEKYAKVYSNTYFKRFLDLDNMNEEAYVLVSNDDFAEIAYVSNLDNEMKELVKNTTFLNLKNLRHILNVSNQSANNIEIIYSKIKDNFPNLKNIALEKIFISKSQNSTFLLVVDKNNSCVLKVNKDLDIKLINLSEAYNILGETRRNLPTVYKENKISKLASIFSIFN